MAGIVSAAVVRLKGQLHEFLSVEAVGQVAGELGLEWKNTPLAVPQTVALFARQILAGNISMPELVRLAEAGVTPEAYCLARSRLPLEVLRELLRRIGQQGARKVRSDQSCLWKNHRVWHIDGSSFSMPDTPALETAFRHPVQQLPGCSFPVAHMLCLFDVSILYNLVRLIMLQAAHRQEVRVERISFADALYWVRHGDLKKELPVLALAPWRPGRIEPRVLKRRRHPYSLMRRPREGLRKELREKR